MVDGVWRSPRRWVTFEGELAIGGAYGFPVGRGLFDPEGPPEQPLATITARDGRYRLIPGASVAMVGDVLATSEVELHHGDRFVIGARIFRLFGGDGESSRREQRHLDTVVDPMTGLFDRRLLWRYLERVSAGALLLIDIDWLKKLCDHYGHVAGDQVIQLTAERIRRHVAWPMLLGRYGGEEFVIVAPGTSVEQAEALGERIRVACEPEFSAVPFEADQNQIRATVSIGVAMLGADSTTSLQTADENLIEAKRAGRNRVFGPSDRA